VDDDDEPIALPIDGELDLHTFPPHEVAELVADYLDECARRGILEVRLIHGKGRGVLRRVVAAALARHPLVERSRPADETQGGWGATIATLRRSPPAK
jgi:DNA-nicking Smr family endonuclease